MSEEKNEQKKAKKVQAPKEEQKVEKSIPKNQKDDLQDLTGDEQSAQVGLTEAPSTGKTEGQKEKKSKDKKKVVFWSLLASGIGVIVIAVVLLLVFLLPKEEKYEIDLGANISVSEGALTGTGSYKKGDSVTIVAEEIEGYRFTGWTLNGQEISDKNEYTFTIDETTEGEYTANYAKLYDITLANNNVSVVIEGNKTQAIADEIISFTVSSEDNKVNSVCIVYNDNSLELIAQEGKYTFAMPEDDVEIIVSYSPLYKLTVISDHGQVTIKDHKIYAVEDEEIVFTVEPDSNYRLLEVKINDKIVQPQFGEYTFNMPAKNVTIDVTYAELFDISVTNEHGKVEITDGKTQAIAGENVEFTVAPNENYRIDEVKVNDKILTAQDGKYIFEMPASDVTIIVSYIQGYNVQVDESARDYITINDDFVLDSATVTFTTTELDSVTDTHVIQRTVQIINNDGQQIDYIQEGNQYSFTMPAQDVMIEIVVSSEKEILQGYSIVGNSITQYTGNESEISLPSSYSPYTYETDGEIEITYDDLMAIFDEDRLTLSRMLKIYSFALPTFTYRYNGMDESQPDITVTNDYSSEQSMWAVNNLLTMPKDHFPLTVKLPKGYTITRDEIYEEDIFMILVQLLPMMMLTSSDYVLSFDIKIDNGEKKTIDYSSIMEVMAIDLSTVDKVEISNVKYGKTIACVGEENKIESIGSIMDLFGILPTNSNVEKITIPKGVTQIGNYAFSDCRSLTEVILPSSLQSIGGSAFSGCYSLALVINNSDLNITKGRDDNGYIGYYALEVVNTVKGEQVQGRTETINNVKYYINDKTDEYIVIGAKADATDIIIEKDATAIKDYAFYHDYTLKSVTFKENSSLTQIGNNAFWGCTSLNSITLPSSLQSIGSSAFYDCYSLAIVINNSINLTLVEGEYNDGNLLNYALEVVNTKLGNKIQGRIETHDSVFYYINDKTGEYIVIGAEANARNITIKKEATAIKNYAFRNNNALQSVAFEDGSSLTSIGGWAFSNGDYLTSITIPEGVTEIGEYAFDNCSLTSITLPSSLQSIGEYAFQYCYSLTSITIPEGVTEIGSSAFYDCYSLAIVINNSLNLAITKGSSSNGYIGYYAVEVVNAGGSVQGRFEVIDNVKYYINGTTGEYIVFGVEANATDITIKKEATAIKNSAFRDNDILQSVAFEDGSSLTSIGGWAFSDCDYLTSITIPEGVTEIGEYAFQYCYSLTSITIPEGVTQIGAWAFDGCSNLTSITLPSSLTSIGEYAFSGCSNLTSITLPSSLTSIGEYAFSGCNNLQFNNYNNGKYLGNDENPYLVLVKVDNTSVQSFEIHKDCKIIYSYVFQSCWDLTSVTIPEGVTQIGEYAFQYCYSLTSITIPEGVTQIGAWAFDGCSNLTSITLPPSLTSIGEYAFSGCSNLTSITLPSSLTSIGEYAFSGCNNLQFNNYNNGKYLGNDENPYLVLIDVDNTSVQSFEIHKDCKIISPYVFQSCWDLTSVTIPEGVTQIGEYAFYGCSNLTSVVIESDDIYKAADGTDYNQIGYLLEYATTVKVLKKIDDGSNTYLSSTFSVDKESDEKYNIYTKL